MFVIMKSLVCEMAMLGQVVVVACSPVPLVKQGGDAPAHKAIKGKMMARGSEGTQSASAMTSGCGGLCGCAASWARAQHAVKKRKK
jgi:hypothetical protein